MSSLTLNIHEAFQKLMLTSGTRLGIISHHEEIFSIVKQVELHHIPRNQCHGSMTQVVVAYPDDSCLRLKGMHNSRDIAKFFQHLRNSCLKTGGNLLNPQLQRKMMQERSAMWSSNMGTTLVVLALMKD
jgi:hypothetical protein